MKVAFTLCSNNYLALAKTLAESYHAHNPGEKFVIGLVDIKSSLIDYSLFINTEIVEIESIGIAGFNDLADKYNIIELNTAVKPFFIQYLFDRDSSVKSVFYLDPDIYVVNSFTDVVSELGDNNILITPHITQPYPLDELTLPERTFLNYGIYNLGFIGLNRSDESFTFLLWWQERLRKFCYIDFADACFTDQLWINFAPLFFQKVKVSFHLGLNVAYWNLNTREITGSQSEPTINNEYPFVFLHISGFNPHVPGKISVVQTRIDVAQRPDILPVYQEYAEKVLANNYDGFKKVPCVYVDRNKNFKRALAKAQINGSVKNRMLHMVYKITPKVLFKTYNAINRELKYYQDL